jgi:tetratricopeptide (TPR) repeat protein
MSSVKAEISKKKIPTVPLGDPVKHPMFFDYRVYQGSDGSVYPLPFIDNVKSGYEDWKYDLIKLENDYVYLEFLPEIGGRIFKGQDKTSNNYDFFYRQDLIKPALVGLAGPWISGGVEFNWPQHHRPGTYMPSDYYIEKEADGAVTVWLSELDALTRMKGTYGIRLRPDSSLIELRARLFNATPVTQTFLWWANVAARVHDQYQSFFPPDVHYVADHAVRAMSSFPVAENHYYGIDYKNRPGENNLDFYRNIPVPTSYMVCETDFGFFGGYDHKANSGFVHVANKHISPGKKQWTWGNHEFGWAWDRELTETGGPYVELMAGVYTDNQPDFSYLLPYEMKCFSQFWWPIQKTGPVQNANEKAALRLVVREDRKIEAAALVTHPGDYRIVLKSGTKLRIDEIVEISPGSPWQNSSWDFEGENESDLSLEVYDVEDRLVINYVPVPSEGKSRNRDVAVEPKMPEEIKTNEELFLIGEHLEQYRHPTRSPIPYWEQAVEREPTDIRSRLALGKAALKAGRITDAIEHLEISLARQTLHHPNPSSGEALYYLGLSFKYLQLLEESYACFYKASWNYEWKSAAYYNLACIDIRQDDYLKALEHLTESRKTNSDNVLCHVLLAVVYSKLGREGQASEILRELEQEDPLNPWLAFEMVRTGIKDESEFLSTYRNDAQTMIDVCLFYASTGLFHEAQAVLEMHIKNPVGNTAVPNPLQESQFILYMAAWLEFQLGNDDKAILLLSQASRQNPDYFFPSRIEEQLVLEWAISIKRDRLAQYAVGNLYYSNKRRTAAIDAWEKAAEMDMTYPTLYRNLSIAQWNANRDARKAGKWFLRALGFGSDDPQLIYEYDLLQKKLNKSINLRLAFLEHHLEKVLLRDDATVQYVELLNLSGKHGSALEILTSRRFHPWEGGEGKVLKQYANAHIGLGVQSLQNSSPHEAIQHFKDAYDPPANLGEDFHYLQSKAKINYWMGMAYKELGELEKANDCFTLCCEESNDFQDMEVVAYTENSIFKAKSLMELGLIQKAVTFLEEMRNHCLEESRKEHRVDYFATSLPDMLVFEDDYSDVQQKHFKDLCAKAESILDEAVRLLKARRVKS